MSVDKIIANFISQRKLFSETTDFSDLPGIYAIFTNSGVLPHIPDSIPADKIIYIGKTEKSQRSRDANTHFATGKTGSSTLRRSIGALYREQMELIPIPRGESDIIKGRKSHFKFDAGSEEKITNWMKSQLSLSFYEYPYSKDEIELLETQLIHRLTPILNLSKNPGNPYKNLISNLRKICGNIAYGAARTGEEVVKEKPVKYFTGAGAKGKYVNLWKDVIPGIITALENEQGSDQIQMDRGEFSKVGNRKSYSFSLEMAQGRVSNNISGSAVARDLAGVLTGSSLVMQFLKDGTYKINMDKNFLLYITKIN